MLKLSSTFEWAKPYPIRNDSIRLLPVTGEKPKNTVCEKVILAVRSLAHKFYSERNQNPIQRMTLYRKSCDAVLSCSIAW